MLMAGALLRDGAFGWAHDGGHDGALRLALALMVIAALVLSLETRGLHWLWDVLT